MKILLFSQVSSDKIFLEKVAAYLKCELKVFASVVALVDDLAKDPTSIVVIDGGAQHLYGSFEKCVGDKLGLYSAVVNPNRYCYFSPHSLQKSPWLHQSQIFGTYLPRIYHENDVTKVGNLFRFINSEKPFELDSLVDASTRKKHDFLIKKASERKAVLAEIEDFLSRWSVHKRAIVNYLTAIEELIINAIFEAPVDQWGKPLFANLARSQEIALEEKSYVTIQLFIEDQRLLVAVGDRYGTLDRGKLIHSIGKSYEFEEYKIKTNSVSAGLGLQLARAFSSGMLTVVEPGVRSEVILFFERSQRFVDTRNNYPFFSTFILAN